jgi:hypothetical protein
MFFLSVLPTPMSVGLPSCQLQDNCEAYKHENWRMNKFDQRKEKTKHDDYGALRGELSRKLGYVMHARTLVVV